MTRRIAFLAIAFIVACPVSASENRLTGKAILETLTDATVEGKNWTQTFDKGGATTYVAAGKTSTGRWDVRADQYCSQWPPSDQWSCYDVTSDIADGVITISWISADGSRESGRLKKEQ